MSVDSRIFPLALFLLTVLSGYAEEAAPRDDLDYRALRREAVGREYEQIKTPRGTIFYKVKILRVDSHRVTIDHQDGRALLEFGSIPEQWVKEFNLAEKGAGKKRAARGGRPAVPEFDLSGTVKVGGDAHGGAGLLVEADGAMYVYTDCATVSGNKKITVQSNDGTVLRLANVIECAEGVPLARIQVKPPGGDVRAAALAGREVELKEHQYLYLLEPGKAPRQIKVRKAESGKIDTTAGVTAANSGQAVMNGAQKAVGIVLAELPDGQRIDSPGTRFESRRAEVVRLDQPFRWKKVPLANFLNARKVMLAFDTQTKVAEAISKCKLSGGKIVYPPGSKALFVAGSKNRNVSDMVDLHDKLENQSIKANENEVQRKLDSIIGTALRRAKKQAEAFSPASVGWYHRQFLTQSLAWRKRVLLELER